LSLITAKILDLSEAKFANDSIPAQLTTATGAFQGNTNLTTIIFPQTLRVIGDKALGGCSNLVKADLPNSVEKIYKYGFNTSAKLQMSSLPGNLKYIGDAAFNGCPKVTFSSLPSGLITLGDNLASAGNGAFKGCTSISISTIPAGVTFIGQDAFRDCTQLTSMTFPAGLTSIGVRVFYNCTGLTNLYFKQSNPPAATVSTNIASSFKNVTLSNITCHVPVGCRNNYTTIDPWSLMNVIDDFTTSAERFQNNSLKAFMNNDKLIIQNIPFGERYSVYSTAGQLLQSGISWSNEVTINIKRGMYIIKAGHKSIKVL